MRRAFTLIELLVVIAIIGVLVSLLLPAVQKVREAANRMQCANNLKQLGLALQNYQSTSKCFPPGQTTLPDGSTFGWVAQILPYIEQDNLYRLYHFDKNWDANNSTTNGYKLPFLRCPSAPSKRGSEPPSATDYSATNLNHVGNDLIDQSIWNTTQKIANGFTNGGVLYNAPATDPTGNTIADILDGTSNTLLLAECAARPQTWFAGQIASGTDQHPYWADPQNMIIARGSTSTGTPTKGGPSASCAVNCYNREEVYAFHPGIANVVFADGSVRSLRASTNLFVLHALITKAGGEVNTLDQ